MISNKHAFCSRQFYPGYSIVSINGVFLVRERERDRHALGSYDPIRSRRARMHSLAIFSRAIAGGQRLCHGRKDTIGRVSRREIQRGQ